MRIQCDYCLSVYESDDAENERGATCPFCASWPSRSTLREFKIVPDRPRVKTSPFGLEEDAAAPPSAPITCPPASRPADKPSRSGDPTPAYVKAVVPVDRTTAPRVDTQPVSVESARASALAAPAASPPATSAEPPAELPGLDPPAIPSGRPRPAYDWELPQVVSGSDDARAADTPFQDPGRVGRTETIPPPAELPRLPDWRASLDTDRPLVRSQPSPPDARKRAAVWMPFVIGAAGAAFLLRGWLASPRAPDETKLSLPATSVASFVTAVDQGISMGDVEQALGALDRASRIAPRDPNVLLARAKLLVERADIGWIVRKATPAAPSEGAAFEDFVRSAGEARAAADDAFRALPESDEARRTLVNALRIFGEIDRGREIASGLRDRTSPESMYALGTLDMAEPGVWSAESAKRLHQTASVSGFPGKGRAVLAYALARSGDFDGANGELEKLSLLARPHPASAALRAFVDSSRVPAKPASSPPRRAKHTKLCPEDLKSTHGDPPSILREALNARCRGDLAEARRLYQSILDGRPDDAEALSGMGDLARQQDAWDTARNFYAEALRANPSFLPAAIGAADVEWDVGNLSTAQRKYREILEAFPNVSRPPRVEERASPSPPGAKGSG